MAKITREKVEEINAKCKNGFMFNLQTFIYSGEKNVIKYIDIEDNKKISATLSYYDRRLQGSYTYKPVICLHLAIWNVEENGMMCSHGLGATIELSGPCEKRKFNDLIAKTAEFDDATILDYASQNMERLKNPFLIG